MPDTSGKAIWGVFGGSTRGSAHLRSGLPNQDSIEKWTGPGGSPAVLAVSDGHGSASHFRSDIGSQKGVEAAVNALRETPVPVPDGHAQVLAQSIVKAWREAVMTHLSTNPFTDQEWSKLPPKEAAQSKAAILENPPLAYGATLLAVLAAESEILYLQLGDGDILCVDQNGGTTRPVPEDSRLIANQTTSLCQMSAVEDFRAAHFRAAEGTLPALILVSSDGYSNSFQSDADFLQVGPDYLDLLRQYGPEKVEAQLEKILPEASRKGSGDDITLGFIERMDDAPKPAPKPAPDPLPQPAAPAGKAEPQPGPPPSATTRMIGRQPDPPPSATTRMIGRQPDPPPSATTRMIGRQPDPPPSATILKTGRQPDPQPAPLTVKTERARQANPKPVMLAGAAPHSGGPPRGASAVTARSHANDEANLLRRQVFWLKMALAAVSVLALAGAGLAWRVWPNPQEQPRKQFDELKKRHSELTKQHADLKKQFEELKKQVDESKKSPDAEKRQGESKKQKNDSKSQAGKNEPARVPQQIGLRSRSSHRTVPVVSVI